MKLGLGNKIMKNIKKQIEETTGETKEDMGLQEEVEYWEAGEEDEDFKKREKEEKEVAEEDDDY